MIERLPLFTHFVWCLIFQYLDYSQCNSSWSVSLFHLSCPPSNFFLISTALGNCNSWTESIMITWKLWLGSLSVRWHWTCHLCSFALLFHWMPLAEISGIDWWPSWHGWRGDRESGSALCNVEWPPKASDNWRSILLDNVWCCWRWWDEGARWTRLSLEVLEELKWNDDQRKLMATKCVSAS